MSALRAIGPWMSTARASARSLSVSIVGESSPDWFHDDTNQAPPRFDEPVPLPLLGYYFHARTNAMAMTDRSLDADTAPELPDARTCPASCTCVAAARASSSTSRPSASPTIVHWGEELADSTDATLRGLAIAARGQRVSGGLDSTPPLTRARDAAPRAGSAPPALEGHRDGAGVSVRFEVVGVQANEHRATIALAEPRRGSPRSVELRVGSERALPPADHACATPARPPYTVSVAAVATFPVPWDATEILDTTGHHLRERSPQRHAFTFGTHVRESRRGRPGADADAPARRRPPGFGFERGRVHGIHVAWSGNHRALAERSRHRRAPSSPAASCSRPAR